LVVFLLSEGNVVDPTELFHFGQFKIKPEQPWTRDIESLRHLRHYVWVGTVEKLLVIAPVD
jgi:hypothetical protein